MKKILVVENDIYESMILSSVLEKEFPNHEVTVVNSPTAATKCLKYEDIGVVIVDLGASAESEIYQYNLLHGNIPFLHYSNKSLSSIKGIEHFFLDNNHNAILEQPINRSSLIFYVQDALEVA